MTEVLVVFILFVLAPYVVFRGVRGLVDSKNKSNVGESGGEAMRRSELQAMIDDAVIEATAPLVARIDELERDMLLGEGRLDASVIAEALEDPDDLDRAAEPRRQRA